jgi:hypothetical protein
VIRQAISCDICASEKRQTNHWFVAYEQAGELRVSGWSSRHKLRPGSKHLCGQTCLHKLVDEFMAKAIAVRAQRPADEPAEELIPDPPAVGDASLTSNAAYANMAIADAARDDRTGIDLESSARLITPPAIALPTAVSARPAYPSQAAVSPVAPAPAPPLLPRPAWRPQPELVPPRSHPAEYVSAPEESPRYASRNWRAEAWERERERELRAIGKHPDATSRRASNA